MGTSLDIQNIYESQLLNYIVVFVSLPVKIFAS